MSVITLYNVLFYTVKMSQNGTGLFCTIKDKIRMRRPEMVQNNPVPFWLILQTEAVMLPHHMLDA